MKKILVPLFPLVAVLCAAHAASAVAQPLYVEVFAHHGDMMVRAGRSEGLRVGASVEIVGGTIAGTSERRNLGGGVVVEVWDHLAKISLDDEVERHRGKRWAKLEGSDSAAAPAVRQVSTASAPQKGGLTGAAELDRKFIFKKQVVLYNYSKTSWSGCELRLPNNTVYGPVRVEPGTDYAVMLSSFVQEGAPVDVPNDHLLVKCAEGSADFALRS